MTMRDDPSRKVRAATTPPPQACRSPGCAEYKQWSDAVTEEIDLDSPPPDDDVVFVLVDAEGKKLAQVTAIIRGPDGVDGEFITDADGEITITDAAGAEYTLIGLKPSDDVVAGIRDVKVESDA